MVTAACMHRDSGKTFLPRRCLTCAHMVCNIYTGSQAGFSNRAKKGTQEGAHDPSSRGRQFFDTQSFSWVRARYRPLTSAAGAAIISCVSARQYSVTGIVPADGLAQLCLGCCWVMLRLQLQLTWRRTCAVHSVPYRSIIRAVEIWIVNHWRSSAHERRRREGCAVTSRHEM